MLIFLLPHALAALPVSPTPDCAEDRPDACLIDFESNWDLSSWIPAGSKETVREEELSLGSGIAVDVAWRSHTGHWDVPVAVLDSGIEWGRGELRAKVLLNTGELPPPRGSDGVEVAGYDLDGNGLVNVDDYAEDDRVDPTQGSDDADHHLDASDLIYAFSDGVDDDQNGYTDDIAGWDFFNHDNDPYAVDGIASYHGSGIMRDAAGEGGEGVCPNCAVIPVRVGDGFITDGDRIAMGAVYAVDRGARSIGMALGGLTLPQTVRQAFEYADSKGVVLVANPGDENSYHRNIPGVVEPVIYVHAVRGGNQQEPDDVYSFLNFPNCNNFGPRVDLVASSEGCGSGATARVAGAAALMLSAAQDAGIELQPVEIRSILEATADDISLSAEESAAAETYPSAPGWDAFYATGRVHVGRAVEAVLSGEIPPTVRIEGPDWYSWTGGEPFSLSAKLDAPRSGALSWTLEAGLGLEPSSWRELASGQSAADGVIAEVDPSEFEWGGDFEPLLDLDVEGRYRRAFAPLLSMRLTVTDAEGRSSTARRGVWVHDDPDMLPGFPLSTGSSFESSPVLADLDGDEVLEVIAVASDGAVYAVDGRGQALPGFPVYTAPVEALADYAGAPAYASGEMPGDFGDGVMGSPSVGDIDGDGAPEIVVATLRGRVFAWRADGAPVEGFPLSIQGREPSEFLGGMAWDNGIAAAPSLGDVDGDGALEIVVGAMDQRLYVWDGQGILRQGYPLELCVQCGEAGARVFSSTSLGDIDGDGDLDGAIGTNELPDGGSGVLWLVDLASGEVLPGWPQSRDGLINQAVLPVLGEGHPSTPALADVDGDGDLEIASFSVLGTTGIIDHSGEELFSLGFNLDRFGEDASFDDSSFFSLVNLPAFGDLTGDGQPELVMGGASIMWSVSLAISEIQDHQQAFSVWDLTDGSPLPAFPQQVEDVSFLASASVADVDGDGKKEALFGTGGSFLHAFSEDGQEPAGWPRFTGGWLMGSPAVGDIDGDGYLDVVQTTRDGLLFAWCTRGPADDGVDWAGMHHDAQNTGNLETPLPAQAGPPPEGGCCDREGRGESALLLLPLLLFGARRRREAP